MRQLATLSILLSLGVGTAVAQPPPTYAPVPPPRVEVIPPPPHGDRFIWEPGHWHWNGAAYVWAGGHYVERRPAYHTWVEGRWAWSPRLGRWEWRPAHWD